jgi:hypothetical protein
MRSTLYGIYFFIISVILLLAIGGAIYIVRMDYDSLIASVVATVHKNGLGEKIRNGIFTRSRFTFLQHMAWLVFVLAPFCCWFAVRYRFSITGYGRFLVMSVWQSIKAIGYIFKNNSPGQNRSVFALVMVIMLFFIYRMITSFLNYDEMWSYNYYTANHFYYSFFTYSNYPLFEMTTHLFKWLPFPMKINLRLSPFIFGMASCFLLYACCRKYFNNHFIAMAGVAAFAFTPITIEFMVSARGVMHELFFAIAGIFSFLFWLNNPDRKQYLVIYFLAGVLGVYSLPTHFLLLVFLLVAGLWILVKKTDRPSAFLFVKINLFILAGFLILYAPILLTTGASVFENLVRSRASYYDIIMELPYFIQYLLMSYAGYSYISISVFAAAIAFILLLKNKLHGNSPFILMLVVGLPVSIIFFYLVTGFNYPGRSLPYGGLTIPLLIFLFVQMAVPWLNQNSIWKKRLVIPAIVLMLLLDDYFYLPVNSINRNVATVARLFTDSNIVSCYDNSSHSAHFYYYYPGIEYYYRVEHKTIEFTISAKNSMRYKPLLRGDKYDCIVYDSNVRDSSRASTFHEIYQDPAGKFIIWMRNDAW